MIYKLGICPECNMELIEDKTVMLCDKCGHIHSHSPQVLNASSNGRRSSFVGLADTYHTKIKKEVNQNGIN